MKNLSPYFYFGMCMALTNCQTTKKEDKSTSGENKKPNIIIVLADDLGYSDIGAYGATKIETPNLDQLAENGLRMTQMHNTSKSFPSRACLLTGLYAQKCDMHEPPRAFHNAVMFGEILRHAGYRTLFVGKHHSLDNPYDWGFDHYRGLRDGASNYFNPGEQRPGEEKPAQKASHSPRPFCFDDTCMKPYTPPKNYYATTTWTDWAIELLDQYKDEDKPFCLYLAYTAPHDPLHAPVDAINKYKGVFDEGFDAISSARYAKQKKMGLLDDRYPLSAPTHCKWDNLSDSAKNDQARRMEVYAAMIDIMDQNIGRVVNKIKSMGKWENTIFMFASDNGASAEAVEIGHGEIGSMTRWASLKEDWANVANTPFRFYKNYSHQGGICTPFIVHWPGVIEKGSINHTQAHFIDILPTFMDLANTTWYPENYKGEKIHPVDGISLLPLFKGSTTERNKPLYFDWRKGSAIMNEKYKLVRWEDDWELFDMQTDKTETVDLANKKPEVLENMKKQWTKWAVEVGIADKE